MNGNIHCKEGFTLEIKSVQIFNIVFLTILLRVIKRTSISLLIKNGNSKNIHASYYIPTSLREIAFFDSILWYDRGGLNITVGR